MSVETIPGSEGGISYLSVSSEMSPELLWQVHMVLEGTLGTV